MRTKRVTGTAPFLTLVIRVVNGLLKRNSTVIMLQTGLKTLPVLCRHPTLPNRDTFFGSAKDYGVLYSSIVGEAPTHVAAGN